MARILQKNAGNKVEDIAVYVIFSPFEKAFYINKTLTEKLKTTYQSHYYLKNLKTKSMFEQAKKEKLIPAIYCLESLNMTQNEAFGHCIAWEKYFSEQGYTSLQGDFFEVYMDVMGEETRAVYNSIKDKKVEDICPTGEDLFPDYGTKRKLKKDTPHRTLAFKITKEEFEKIEKAAVRNQISVSKYCKDMALNGKIINVDFQVISVFNDYLEEFIRRDTLLKQLLNSISRFGEVYPANYELIQNMIDENNLLWEKASAELSDTLKKLIEEGGEGLK